ncbi:MAG: right-handed parallel beta-helix repeat-containing protein [Blastocatellia bacterium]
MRKFPFALNILAIAVFSLAIPMVAQAQATRTWVSGVGDDANPCSRTAPCKTFAGAISKTAASGEISVLDPGGFGAVTITKSITINGDGTLAGILASLVNGIIINAGTNDKVIIRSISLNGAGNGLDGIRFLAGKQLSVENVTIIGFTGQGIDASLPAAGGNLYVKDTNITRCADGITMTVGAGGFLVANIDNVRIEGMTSNGIVANAGAFANVRNSSIFNNPTNGLQAANGATVNVENTYIAHNGTGVNSAAGSAFRLSNTTIFNNATGINAGGSVRGFFNNRVFGNGVEGAVNAQTVQQ